MGVHNDVQRIKQFENSNKSKLKDVSAKQCIIKNQAKDDSDSDETVFEDDEDYDRYVPIKYTQSLQLSELKLQSSLLQILQQEIPNVKKIPVACTECRIPHCFNCSRNSSTCSKKSMISDSRTAKEPVKKCDHQRSQTSKLTRKGELEHEREPKWESYIEYVKPRKCQCSKTSKKQLFEHLPAYMRKTSSYDAPKYSYYDACPVTELQSLVKNANSQKDSVAPSSATLASTKEISTQYSDPRLKCLCSNVASNHFERSRVTNLETLELPNTHNLYGILDNIKSDLTQDIRTFAKQRATSLKNFIVEVPELKEIFETKLKTKGKNK